MVHIFLTQHLEKSRNMFSSVNPPKRHKNPLKCVALCAIVAMFGVTACEEQVNVRGNLPHEADIAKIRKGFHKKRDIENLLGTPSAVATFKKETWYYIGGRVKTLSFFKPEFLDRKVVIVKFNDSGVVDTVEARDAPKDKDIKLVERETPTKGRDLTVIQQLIGNVGRFSTSETDGDSQ
jgi:outer membrane protein assembly factor BamE (lipoprotein component of BamABCDE complex)